MTIHPVASPPPLARILESAAPRQDCVARLLLLLARTSLTEEQMSEVRRLAEGVSNWKEVAQIAAQKFIATYAYKHISSAAKDIIPQDDLDLLRRLAHASALSSLRVAAAQLAFHQICIASTGASHAYLKGAALAAQNAVDVGSRPSRDVDVLVAACDFRAVLNRAISAGYSVFIDAALSVRAANSQDINFLARHADVVTVFDSSGVPIEIHRRLDKLSVNFDVAAALATSVPVRLFGVPIQTLCKPFHFNYVCYHHSRHFWSKLHWVADLDTMVRDPDFDKAAVRRIADDIGLTPTTDAALEFSALVSQSDTWDGALASQNHGAQFLAACLFNLDGELELEQSLRKGMPFGDFISGWQIDAGRFDHFSRNAWWRRLRPTTAQYLRHRLPQPFQWLYVVRNGASLARSSLAQAVGLVARAPPRPTQRSQPRQSS